MHESPLKKARKDRGTKAHRAGHAAEYVAAAILLLKGYRILGMNTRTPFGEVDILAARQNSLIAVEVKMRRNAESAGAAISPAQQQRLLNALQFLAARHTSGNRAFTHLRGDAMLFVRGKMAPEHVKNAFFGQ
jgi:putative endonuclease